MTSESNLVAAAEKAGMSVEQRRVLIVAILASFMAILDGSVVQLALPAMAQDLGGDLSAQQWILESYLLTLSALILVAGSLSDLYGRNEVMRVGLLGFAITSVACGLAFDPFSLIIARGFQGAAAALMVPSSLAMIMSAFTGPAKARAIGLWTASTGVATVVSPLIGGISVDLLNWRVIFFINLLPVLIALPVLAKITNHHIRDRQAKIDVTGSVLGVLGLGGSVFALIEAPRYGISHPLVFIPAIIGVLGIISFLIFESRTAKPMVPLSLFGIRNFSIGNITTFFIYGALSLGFFVLGLYLQEIAGLSATMAGLAMIPSTFLLLGLSSLFGDLAGKYGPRLFMSLGPVIAGFGYLLLLSISPDFNYWWQVLPGIVIFGLGLAITVAPLTAGILGAVPEANSGVGSALNNAISRVAGLITVAFVGLIMGTELNVDGLHRTMIVCAIMLIGAGIFNGWGIQNPQPSKVTSITA